MPAFLRAGFLAAAGFFADFLAAAFGFARDDFGLAAAFLLPDFLAAVVLDFFNGALVKMSIASFILQ